MDGKKEIDKMNLSQYDICMFYLPFCVDTTEVVLHCHFIFGPVFLFVR